MFSPYAFSASYIVVSKDGSDWRKEWHHCHYYGEKKVPKARDNVPNRWEIAASCRLGAEYRLLLLLKTIALSP